MGQGALSKPAVQWWLSLNSSTRGQECPGAAYSRAEHVAAHHSRENAGRGFFAAAERSSSWARVVCCVGQARVNGTN